LLYYYYIIAVLLYIAAQCVRFPKRV